MNPEQPENAVPEYELELAPQQPQDEYEAPHLYDELPAGEEGQDPGIAGVPELVEVEIEEGNHKPIFTLLAIVINTVLFLVSIAKNGWDIAPLKVNPMIGPDSSVLVDLGAKITSKIVEGEWWRLIAPMWLHAGFLHLLMNMVMLWRLGSNLEQAFGTLRIFCIYFLSGLFGVLMSAIFLPGILGVGASGAIYGLVGALFGDFYHNYEYIREGKIMVLYISFGFFADWIGDRLIAIVGQLWPYWRLAMWYRFVYDIFIWIGQRSTDRKSKL